jgi:hypothetical protein
LGLLPGAMAGAPPGGSQLLPPSSERWIIWPNHPLVCDAYSRFGSAVEPFTWKTSQPPKCGPPIRHLLRMPSDVIRNAPFRVPTNNRTLLIPSSSLFDFLVQLPGYVHCLRSGKAPLSRGKFSFAFDCFGHWGEAPADDKSLKRPGIGCQWAFTQGVLLSIQADLKFSFLDP